MLTAGPGAVVAAVAVVAVAVVNAVVIAVADAVFTFQNSIIIRRAIDVDGGSWLRPWCCSSTNEQLQRSSRWSIRRLSADVIKSPVITVGARSLEVS